MTRREYCASLTPPLAIAGARGKLSTAAHEAIAKAEASGMVFAETQYTINIKAAKEPKPVKVKPEPTNANVVLTPIRTHSTDTVWIGKDKTGNSVSANYKQICIPCGCSLVGHDCVSPATLTATYPNGRVCMELVTLEVKS